MRWFAATILILMLCGAGIWTYRRVQKERDVSSGAIQSSDLMSAAQEAEWERRRRGDQTPESAPTGVSQLAPDTIAGGSELNLPSVQQESAIYAGHGRFQWFRQANLTWRLDTESGASCIVYATLEEWNKQLVKSHGCSHSSTRP